MGTVLILGSNGSVAGPLISYLSSKHRIKCVDSDVIDPASKLDFAQLDVTNPGQFQEYLASIKDSDFPEYLVNLCGRIVSRSILDPNILNANSVKIDHDAHLGDFNDNVSCQSIPMLVFSEELIKRKKTGKIINFSSMNSSGVLGQFGYSAAKSTVESMSRNLALEVGVYGIQINCISPGYIDLPNLSNNMNQIGISRVIQKSALKKLVDIQDVCLAVDFLIKSEGVSGTTLHVHSNIG
jgi:NAD(P)-dependent dehydrogenase (short-subunit alcohol dehydrogenase family)